MNMRLAKRLFGGAIGAMAIMIVVIFINKLCGGPSEEFKKVIWIITCVLIPVNIFCAVQICQNDKKAWTPGKIVARLAGWSSYRFNLWQCPY